MPLQVVFKNEITNEYLFYNIKLNVKQRGPLEEIKLITCVRLPKIYKLKLENPLKKEVTFTITSNCDRLEYEKAIIVQPCSEKIVDITYLPLLPGVIDVNLEVITKELGVFMYQLCLEAFNAEPEPPLIFKCALGQCAKKKVYLENYCKTKSDCKMKVS